MSVNNGHNVEQVIEIIVEALRSKIELSESRGVAERVKSLLDSGTDLFEVFRLCYDHLANLVDQGDTESNDGGLLLKSQLKLCHNDHSLHSCAFLYLLNCFQHIVPVNYCLTVKIESLAGFIHKLKCISLVNEVIDVFRVTSTFSDCDSKRSLVQYLLDTGEFVKASMVIPHLDLYEYFDSNYILVNLLNQGNFNLIQDYLKLSSLRVTYQSISNYIDPTKHNSIDLSKPEYILLDFLHYIDQLFVNIELLDADTKAKVHRVPELKRKIDHYVIDLFKSDVFGAINDTTLCSICKNVTKNFYRKQLSSLLYSFKEGRMSIDVINDHLEYMKRSPLSGFLISTTHRQVISVLTKQKNYITLNKYCQMHHLQCPKISAASLSPDEKKTNYLKLDKKINFIDTEKLYYEFLQEIQKWSYLCLDCEWFSNRFVLRSSSQLCLVQVSNESTCYVIDCIALLESLPRYMGEFVEKIINNESICKVGYSIDGDFQAIWTCYQDSAVSNVDHATIILNPANVVDFRDLFFFLVSESYPYRTMFDPEVLACACDQAGISQVIYLLLDCVLDKTEQMSAWLNRPLRKSQTQYAALDAYSLAKCYHSLDRLLQNNFQMNFPQFITDVYTVNLNVMKQLSTKFDKKWKASVSLERGSVSSSRMPINQFRCVVDTMLFGIVRYLRICNADTVTVESGDRDEAVKLALREERVFLTCGTVYDRYRKHFNSPHDCIRLNNGTSAIEQFKELITRCNLTITLQDLFARCSLCNWSPFLVMDADKFYFYFDQYQQQIGGLNQDESLPDKFMVTDSKSNSSIAINFSKFSKMKFTTRMPNVSQFYICSHCGHVYWDGCHYSNFIESIKSFIVEA